MRIASRIAGILLALAGLGFLVVSVFVLISGFGPDSVLAPSHVGRAAWIGELFFAAMGVGLLLEGRYFLKLDIDTLDERSERPASRFALYFIAHRREVKLIAQVGFAISLIQVAAACFGVVWPARWAAWPLILAVIGLAAVEARIADPKTPSHFDWHRAPEGMRPVFGALVKAGEAAFLILLLLLGWSQWAHHPKVLRIVEAGLFVLAFTREALFFSYGKLRTLENASNNLKT
jgi:hypothetical protein